MSLLLLFPAAASGGAPPVTIYQRRVTDPIVRVGSRAVWLGCLAWLVLA